MYHLHNNYALMVAIMQFLIRLALVVTSVFYFHKCIPMYILYSIFIQQLYMYLPMYFINVYGTSGTCIKIYKFVT